MFLVEKMFDKSAFAYAVAYFSGLERFAEICLKQSICFCMDHISYCWMIYGELNSSQFLIILWVHRSELFSEIIDKNRRLFLLSVLSPIFSKKYFMGYCIFTVAFKTGLNICVNKHSDWRISLCFLITTFCRCKFCPNFTRARYVGWLMTLQVEPGRIINSTSMPIFF